MKQSLLAGASGVCDAAVDFRTAAAGIIDLHEEAVDTAFTHLTLDEQLRAEFTQVFRSYVSYLTAAPELSLMDGWRTGVALTSQGSSPGTKHALKEILFPVRSPDLLRDPPSRRRGFRLPR